MSLLKYKKKRNLKISKEPKGKIKKEKSSDDERFRGGVDGAEQAKSRGKKLIYVIHEHHASHLHWDLRLEFDGVLKSWAIPKIPPTTKEIKRLAIQVEDHPIEYAKFHGIIPEGNYGAGEVKIWDKGFYNLIEKNKTPNSTKKKIINWRSKEPKVLVFEIHGKKLKGKYCLIKTNYGNKKSWLFFKI